MALYRDAYVLGHGSQPRGEGRRDGYTKGIEEKGSLISYVLCEDLAFRVWDSPNYPKP